MKIPWVSLKVKVVRNKIKTNRKLQNYILYNFMEENVENIIAPSQNICENMLGCLRHLF